MVPAESSARNGPSPGSFPHTATANPPNCAAPCPRGLLTLKQTLYQMHTIAEALEMMRFFFRTDASVADLSLSLLQEIELHFVPKGDKVTCSSPPWVSPVLDCTCRLFPPRRCPKPMGSERPLGGDLAGLGRAEVAFRRAFSPPSLGTPRCPTVPSTGLRCSGGCPGMAMAASGTPTTAWATPVSCGRGSTMATGVFPATASASLAAFGSMAGCSRISGRRELLSSTRGGNSCASSSADGPGRNSAAAKGGGKVPRYRAGEAPGGRACDGEFRMSQTDAGFEAGCPGMGSGRPGGLRRRAAVLGFLALAVGAGCTTLGAGYRELAASASA